MEYTPLDDFKYQIKEDNTILLLHYNKNNSKTINIPDTYQIENKEYKVTEIGSFCFYETKCKNIQLPNSIENLGESCFFYSTVEKIKLSSNTKIIPKSCFSCCNNLKKVTPLKQIEKIRRSAFAYCENLESIQLNNIKKIGEYVFLDCKSLKKLEMPNDIKEICTGSFYNCNNLELEDFENQYIKIKKIIFIKKKKHQKIKQYIH